MNDDLKRWDEEAEIWDSQLQKNTRVGKLILDAGFKQLLGETKNKKVLDAGCGNGRMSDWLQKAGADVVGIDGSSEMIKIAKSRFPSINFVTADLLENLPFQDNTIDVITCSNVLMSLRQIDIFLSEALRILKPDSYLIVSVLHPAFNSPTMKLYRPWWYKIFGRPVMGLAYNYFQKTTQRKDDYGSKPWPFYHRTLEQYVDAFRKNGFNVDRITEPNEVDQDIVEKNHRHYALRLPRFIFFKLIKQ